MAERLARAEYEFAPAARGWSAPNREQGWRVLVNGEGVIVSDRAVSAADLGEHCWLSLATQSIGRARTPAQRLAAGTVDAAAAQVTVERGAVREWFVNRARGLEHGFTIAAAPAGSGEVRIELALGGALLPVQLGDAIVFRTKGGAAVLRYGEIHVTDAAQRALPATLALESQRVIVCFDDQGASYPVTVDPLLTSASWSAEGDQDGAGFGASLATAGDVNGDGYSDVLVGAPTYDNGEVDEGRAYLFLGAAGGLSLTPAWTAEGDQPGALLGSMVAVAGDVDGDGYHDVLVAASGLDDGETDEGAALLFRGSALGLDATPAWRVEGDQDGAGLAAVAGAGDVDGDGFDDVVIGAAQIDRAPFTDNGEASVYAGGAGGLALTAMWTAAGDQDLAAFAGAVAAAGDVDGDGFADVLVGASRHDGGARVDDGQVTLYRGSPSGPSLAPSWTAEGLQDGAHLGSSVATAGDVNGDGYADVLVGASEHDSAALVDDGRAELYLGSAAGPSLTPDWTVDGAQDGARLGSSVATAGDVNGDGFADAMIGAPGFDSLPAIDDGRATIHLGAAAGLRTTPAWVVAGDQDGAAFGSSVATAGDVNGDGYSDVLVGAPAFDDGESDEGRATLYLGGGGTLSTSASWNVASAQFQGGLGLSVASAGDVNGDGYGDVVVGAPFYDHGEIDEGRAEVYLGSRSGLATVPSWSAEGGQAFAKLGWSVAGAHDVNGDGYSDVIVGAPFYDNGSSDEGRALLFYGSSAGLAPGPGWSVEGNSLVAELGFSVAPAADVNGDGFADVIVGAPFFGPTDEGEALVFAGGGAGLSLAPVWIATGGSSTAQLGWSVASAGDVNGDGFGDLVAGAPFYDHGETDEGRALLYVGSRQPLASMPAWSVEGDEPFAGMGWSVAGAGDVNGDGFADVLVGTPLHDSGQTNAGRASLYLGSASLPSLAPDWSVEGDRASAGLGRVVASAGDVNGDGFADLVVAAPFFANGETSEGAVFVFHGSGGGPSTVAAWQVEGNQPFAELGWSAAAAGDVNGDGFGDLVAGAPLFDGTAVDEGACFAFYGNDGGGLDRSVQQTQAADGSPIDLMGRSHNPSWFKLAAIGRTRLAAAACASSGSSSGSARASSAAARRTPRPGSTPVCRPAPAARWRWLASRACRAAHATRPRRRSRTAACPGRASPTTGECASPRPRRSSPAVRGCRRPATARAKRICACSAVLSPEELVMRLNRRQTLWLTAGAAVGSLGAWQAARAGDDGRVVKVGRLKQSVSRWCYGRIPMTEFCSAVAAMGLTAIDLLNEAEWQELERHRLTCSMGYAGGGTIADGLNVKANHAAIVKNFEQNIPRAAQAGVPNVITFFGNRRGLGDAEAIDNCVAGLDRVKRVAEDHGVTVCVELLNSKVDHKDYQGDRTTFGVEVVKRVDSPRVKLLYDIYHMQIMEGDVIRTIRDNHQHIAHYHTGGVPGRNELDDTQELNWAAVCRAIAATGFQGYVAHEFVPTRDPDPLREAVALCDV
ncbi:MAG: FG-GAP-like repeat-containing protein [Planctomycetota bacterium]